MKKTSLHEELGPKAIPVLQGMMGSMAEKLYPIPARFVCTPGSDGRGNNVDIKDSVSGVSFNVGFCDYHGARKAIQALFPLESLDQTNTFE